MQKVVGSNPISRFVKAPLRRGFFVGAGRSGGNVSQKRVPRMAIVPRVV